jgi:hypothetical protein
MAVPTQRGTLNPTGQKNATALQLKQAKVVEKCQAEQPSGLQPRTAGSLKQQFK